MNFPTLNDDDIDTNCGLLYRVSLDDGSTRLMRNLRRMFRVRHAWFDIDTQMIVGLVWLAKPGKAGPTRVRFSDLSYEETTPAFGGAIVTKMELAIGLGGTVSWAIWSGGQWRINTGVVEEIVLANCVPDRTRFPQLFRSSRVAALRNHRSFVLRAPGAISSSVGKICWPRVSSLIQN